MFLIDFAENRNVKVNTITAYIKLHEQEFRGHTWLKDRKKWLDDTAVNLLEQKYPAPKPIQVIEDNEARMQLIEAQQLIIQLQQQLVEAAPKIAWAEQNQKLLEATIKENEMLQVENALKLAESELKVERNEEVVAFLKAELEDNWEEEEALRDKIKQLEKENEALKNRSFLSRLRNDMPSIEVIEVTENIYRKKLKMILSQNRDQRIEQILNGENDKDE